MHFIAIFMKVNKALQQQAGRNHLFSILASFVGQKVRSATTKLLKEQQI
jgi:hypothetical protein